MLYKDRQFVNERTLISIYHAVFDPHLKYAFTVWGKQKVQSIEYLLSQRKP